MSTVNLHVTGTRGGDGGGEGEGGGGDGGAGGGPKQVETVPETPVRVIPKEQTVAIHVGADGET